MRETLEHFGAVDVRMVEPCTETHDDHLNIVWLPRGIEFHYIAFADCMLVVYETMQHLLPEEMKAVQRYAQMLLALERQRLPVQDGLFREK